MVFPATRRVVDAVDVATWERLVDPPGQQLEMLFGEVFMNPAPSPRHQMLGWRLAAHLDAQLPEGLVAVTDVEWRIPVDPSRPTMLTHAPRPDVAVVKEAEVRPGVPALSEVPTLAVELLSPSDSKARRSDKAEVYLQAGLRWYATMTTGERLELRLYQADPGAGWVERARVTPGRPAVVDEPIPLRLDLSAL